jgi:hypothetical protein
MKQQMHVCLIAERFRMQSYMLCDTFADMVCVHLVCWCCSVMKIVWGINGGHHYRMGPAAKDEN